MVKLRRRVERNRLGENLRADSRGQRTRLDQVRRLPEGIPQVFEKSAEAEDVPARFEIRRQLAGARRKERWSAPAREEGDLIESMRFWLLLCWSSAALMQAQETAKKAALPPDHADVAYGPHERNKLDLWLAKTDKPAPLIVFIHGGGFVGGDKSGVNQANLRRALAAGVSFAAINYRFRTDGADPDHPARRGASGAVSALARGGVRHRQGAGGGDGRVGGGGHVAVAGVSR